ncbi:hypothetical protein ACIFQM_00820 [Paenibacillus sp. NRS-1782]|uniref:hypothetical protein n=1 Tax=unclassified Paenibacillus TaxID=185978 RepID=UPI003D2A0705
MFINSELGSKNIAEWKNVMEHSGRVFWCNSKRLDAVPKILDTYSLPQDMQFSLRPRGYYNTDRILQQLIHAIYGLTPESLLPALRSGREGKTTLSDLLAKYNESVWDALEDGEDLAIVFSEQSAELGARSFDEILTLLRGRSYKSYEQRHEYAIKQFVKGKAIKLDFIQDNSYNTVRHGWVGSYSGSGKVQTPEGKFYTIEGYGSKGSPEWVDFEGGVRIRQVSE